MVLISYWVILSVVISFFSIFVLSNANLILKNSKIGDFFRSSLTRYFVQRILISVVSLLFISICLFFLLRLIIMNNDEFINTTSNQLNKPFIDNENIGKDFINYLYNILPFPKKVCVSTQMCENKLMCSGYEYKIINFGNSLYYMRNVDVSYIIREKAAVSFKIGFIAYVLECIIGYPLGIYMSRKKGKFIDNSINFIHSISISFPKIIQFYIFSVVFLVYFKLPVSFDKDNYLTYIAPLLSVVILSIISVAFWVKKYILLEEKKDYVKYAKSKGLNEKYIFYKHIFRNALPPLIRTIPTSLFACLCGYYLLELSFNIPGIGLTLSTVIILGDVYLIQGIILFFSFFSILSYLLGDLIAVLLDKRISFKKEVNVNEK